MTDDELVDEVLRHERAGGRATAEAYLAFLRSRLEGPLRAEIAEYRAALDYLLEQTVDMDLKYGIGLSEGEEDARQKALALFARAAV
jgi:hypothetical protein